MKKRILIISAFFLIAIEAISQNPVVGTWKGSYGNGSSQTGYFYSLRFNADGTLNVLDPNGTSICTGNYSFSNNTITASYYYNGNQLFSLSGTFNPANNTISGTGGSGTSVSGLFGWIMTSKQSTLAATPFLPKTQTNYTRVSQTQTKQPATIRPMQVTPAANSGMIITGTVNTFNNPTNTITMADGTKLSITLRANMPNLPTKIGGEITEREVDRVPVSSGLTDNCVSVTKTFTATSNNFMNSEYGATSASIFPGAIYTASDFMTGNRKPFEYNRNPVEIGIDNVLNTNGTTYRTVNQPTQNEISSAISSIAGTMNGSPEDIKYRVYISESDAEQALNAAASGSFAGFTASAEYRNRSREHVRLMTIDATKTYFTANVNLPANGYFGDNSILQNNQNLVIIKNVIYGCRVMANIIISTSARQDEANFLAAYQGVEANAQGVFNYLRTHNNFESTVNAMVIGGPAGTTTFNAANLEAEISNLMARANYRNARPIAYTLADMNGNIIGIQSATDNITVPYCTPKDAVYTLKSARMEVTTGNNDPKNEGSLANFSLNNNVVMAALDNSPNNIEFRPNSLKSFDLKKTNNDPILFSITRFDTGNAVIDFTPVQIFAGWDEWQISSVVVYLEFYDQDGNPHPANKTPIRYDNLNVYLKKDRSRLVLPFTFNGAYFVAGGPYLP